LIPLKVPAAKNEIEPESKPPTKPAIRTERPGVGVVVSWVGAVIGGRWIGVVSRRGVGVIVVGRGGVNNRRNRWIINLHPIRGVIAIKSHQGRVVFTFILTSRRGRHIPASSLLLCLLLLLLLLLLSPSLRTIQIPPLRLRSPRNTLKELQPT
jgi:hypothetical protein